MSPDSELLRSAGAGDVERVAALEQSLFGIDAWSEDSVARSIGTGAIDTEAVSLGSGRIALVLDDGEQLTAYGLVQVVGEIADLHRIGVASTCQGVGRARLLLAALIRAAGDQGGQRMLLEVSDRNLAALALYRSAGFAEISRRHGYYRDGANALILERTL